MAIRSGRFRAEIKDLTKGITIIKGRGQAFFRIFNSGEKPFIVKPQGPGTPAGKEITLNPTFSVDVATKGGNDDVVITAKTAGEVVEGIYDYLDTQNPIRSGRFKIKALDSTKGNAVGPMTPHKIIFWEAGNPTAWYRIFNSGDNPIILDDGSSSTTTIENGQSLDFSVVGPYTKPVSVQSTANNKSIEGIYEFLGVE